MARRIVVAALLLAAAAHAEEEFGHRGQVVPFGFFSYSHVSANDQSIEIVSIAPGVLWFFTDSIAIGGSPRYAFTSAALGGSSAHLLGLEPIVAVAVPLAAQVALFPRFGMEFSWIWSGGTTSNSITLDGFAPVVFFPVPHLYLGVGPQLRTDLVSAPEVS